MKKNHKIIVIIVVAIIVVAAFLEFYPREGATKNLDDFAKCLAQKNVTMYGAYWCSHCQSQKAEFGDSFKYVPYVECADEPQKCTDAGVEGTPTWILVDGTKLVGEQSLEKLAQVSDCKPGDKLWREPQERVKIW
ncbi:MAG: hypothetical protein KGJ89_03100 [Patescibacteria group bacterium]|nr:hypothetical protein [Patescibacteria group bacterium]MDE2015462.1 hypothetical protein [Patescibacteria group bacterium]MDE2226922.1 hypothetical protein [Patescibacteria group bacterium]